MKIIPGIKIIANTIQIIGSINIPNKNIPKYIKIFKAIGIYYSYLSLFQYKYR